MSYQTVAIWAKSISYGAYRPKSAIKYIVLHYTGNKTDSAKGNANFFSANGDNTRKAGAHYFVDENYVVQSIAEDKTAWSVGGEKYSNSRATGGGTKYGIVTNYNSISIEMCSKNGAIAEKTVQNAVELTKKLMNKYSIPLENVVRHFDVTGKDCPGWYGWNGRGTSGKWEDFKKRLADRAGVTVKSGTKLRAKSGKNNEVIAVMQKDTKFDVLAQTPNWIKIGVWVAKRKVE